jgi:hypothetical protein
VSVAEPLRPRAGRRAVARSGYAFGLEVVSPAGVQVLPAAAEPVAGRRRTRIEARPAVELEREWAFATQAERVLERRFRDGRLVMSVDQDLRVGYRVYAPRNGRHLVSPDGARIASALPRIAPWRWQRLLFAQVLPLAATLRGLELLHASAVELDGRVLAFVARAGTGKTSVAAHLVARGAQLVTDDVLAVEWIGGRLLAHPGAPTFNVAAEQFDSLSAEGRTRLGRPLGTADKRVLAAPVAEQAAPLGALYFLERPVGERIRIVETAPDPLRVLASSFNLYVRTPGRIENQLETAARISETVPTSTIAIPSGAAAPEVARAVAAHAGGRG